jgi:hypothetical protein
MAAPTALLVLLMAAIGCQILVAGMRQQAAAGLSGGGGGGSPSGRPSAYPALRFHSDQTFKILQVLATVLPHVWPIQLNALLLVCALTPHNPNPLQLTDLHYGEDRRLDEKSDQASWICVLQQFDLLQMVGFKPLANVHQLALHPKLCSSPQFQRDMIAAEQPDLVVFRCCLRVC